MANEEEIEELKRLVEEETTKRRAYLREKRRKQIANYTPEQLAEHRRKAIARAGRYKRERVLRNASRPKPHACEVCEAVGKVVFDHCHTSTEFRGWLCQNCNLVLGHVKDDPRLLEKLAVYLRTHGGSDAIG